MTARSHGSVDASLTDAARLTRSGEPPRLVPRRHIGSIIAAVIVIYIAGSLIWIVATSPQFRWETVGSYLFNPFVMNGLWATIYLTAMVCLLGATLGLVIAVMMGSRNRLLRWIANTYVWAVRGIPALVQILLWYNLAALFPLLNFGIPPFGPVFFSVDPNLVMTPIVAALLGLGISDSAYMAEIMRGGIMSVGKGQREAAAALGIPGRVTLMRIVLPQALRAILPAIGNQVIGNLKYTSLASVIGTMELLTSVQRIYAVNYQVIPLLLTASVWYIVLTTILTIVQRRIEKHFGRGFGSEVVSTKTGAISTMTGRLMLRRPSKGRALVEGSDS